VWPRSGDDDAVATGQSTPDTGQRLATWAWVAVVVAVLDTIADVVSLVIGFTFGIQAHIAETGSWISLIARPTFPPLAAVMLRDRDRERSTSSVNRTPALG
jgi:hypothetical protein